MTFGELSPKHFPLAGHRGEDACPCAHCAAVRGHSHCRCFFCEGRRELMRKNRRDSAIAGSLRSESWGAASRKKHGR